MNPIERQIVYHMTAKLKAIGYELVGINDGEEYQELPILDIYDLAENLDECHLVYKTPYSKFVVYLIFGNGNDGRDVITDYTAKQTTEAVMNEVCDFSEKVGVPMDLGIDWALLREQKATLVSLCGPSRGRPAEHLEGLVHLLDGLQDHAVSSGLATHAEVFGTLQGD